MEMGIPYDNVMAEVASKTFKTEFVKEADFIYQQAHDLVLFDYVYWFNNIRIHGSLDYVTPTEDKLINL